MFALLVATVALCSAAADARSAPDVHAAFRSHMTMIKEQSIEPLSATEVSALGKSATAGSYTTKIYSSPTCSESSLYSASGYVYNRCIAIDKMSFKYSDCSSGGGKTTVMMTYCSSSDCSSGCMTYPLSVNTGCQTSSIFSCESSKEPWSDLGLNSHME